MSDQDVRKLLNLDDLPQEVTINTMTLTFKFNTKFNTDNIGKYVTLSENGIQTIKYVEEVPNSNNLLCFRRWNKKVIDKKIHKSNAFLHQASIELQVDNANINIKIFGNGSMQMTGCKGVDNFINIIKILCVELRKIKGIMNKETYKLELKPFATSREEVLLNKIDELNIRMIQTNFTIGLMIDRGRLCKLLINKGIHATFDPDNHSGVNIRFRYSNTKVLSLFVFESSDIILTGVNNREHIIKAFNFIVYMILNNYKEVVSINVDRLIEENIIDMANIQLL